MSKSQKKPAQKQSKRPKGRPTEKDYPERIDAAPEEIAEMVLRMPNKKSDEWRYLKE
ncbi:MAG: hypothetical protein OXG15_01320 [Gammaproteobacteria bacterium]|nr:hypothetical protein [Gammaproteobacteria bacterium]